MPLDAPKQEPLYSRAEVEQYLKDNGIKFTVHEHPAVFTCAEAEKLCGNIPGIACKNLLLKDRASGKCYLIILPADTKVDFKKIAQITGSKKITFADDETLKEKLGLNSGAVSPFGLLNDSLGEVVLIIHFEVLNAEVVSFHPNINTATLELKQEMFQKFLILQNRPTAVID